MNARGGNLRRLLLMLLLLTAFAAQANAEGLNMSWDACGSEGVDAKFFACDTNAGPGFSLYCSFIAPVGTTAVTGAEVTVDLMACSSMPDWWQFKNAGTCRRTALIASADFTGMESGVCTDFWLGQAAGGLASYSTWLVSSVGRARIYAVIARPPASVDSLEAGREYAVARFTFSRTATVGAGSCAGCTVPVLMWLSEVHLSQPVGVGDFRIAQEAERSSTTWQTNRSPYQFCGDPVRNSTWGAIKSQYR